MQNYSFVIAPWTLEKDDFRSDILNQTLELSISGSSYKNALQKLYYSYEFDEYIHTHTTVYVYYKSHISQRIFLVPKYEDIDY